MKILLTSLLVASVWMTAPSVLASDQGHTVSENAKATLYDDLGGEPGVRAVIDHMLGLTLDDPKMAPIFDNTNIDRLKSILFIHTCHMADGPCDYKGQDMRRAHDGLGVRTWHFNKLVENMQTAMDAQNIPFRVQNKLMARLAPFHDDVTERSLVPPREAVKPESFSEAPHDAVQATSQENPL